MNSQILSISISDLENVNGGFSSARVVAAARRGFTKGAVMMGGFGAVGGGLMGSATVVGAPVGAALGGLGGAAVGGAVGGMTGAAANVWNQLQGR